MIKKRSKVFIALMVISFMLVGISAYSNGNKVSSESNFVVVSHSEYWSGETGQIIGKLYNYKGQPIFADCNVTIYNPDKSIFLSPTPTDDTLEAVDGTHYINFTTPSLEGVYEYKLDCAFPNSLTTSRTISNSFHLNPALNLIKTLNSSITGLGDVYTTVVNINNTANNIYSDMFSDMDAYNNFTVVNNNFATVNYNLANIQNNLTQIKQFCSDAETNSSDLCQLIWQNHERLISVENDVNYISDVQLQVINATTQNTYDYMTGTLATNVNNIYNVVLGIQTTVNDINATVNTINTNVNDVKANISTVITNQEDVVYIDVTS